MNWFLLPALLAAGCTVSPTAIQAADAEGATSRGHVNMSNIDASSQAGAERLLRRIRDAALTQCDVDHGLRAPVTVARERACMQIAMASDVGRVESPIVTARFNRVGAAMILEATAGGAGFAEGQGPAENDQNAIASMNAARDIAASLSANRRRLEVTTDDLNHRESARLRGLVSSN